MLSDCTACPSQRIDLNLIRLREFSDYFLIRALPAGNRHGRAGIDDQGSHEYEVGDRTNSELNFRQHWFVFLQKMELFFKQYNDHVRRKVQVYFHMIFGIL